MGIDSAINSFGVENVAVLDEDLVACLMNLSGDTDPDFFESLVESFISSGTMLLSEIETVVALGDVRRLKQLTHDLKGSAASIGASLLSSLCEGMEARIRNNESTSFAHTLRRLRAVHDVTSQLLREKASGRLPPRSSD